MVLKFMDKSPEIHSSCFVAENASVIGDVTIGEKSSVWFGAVIRGDDHIEIGVGSSVLDNAVLHCDLGYPMKIGNNVSIGHRAVVHGATIGDNVLIGMGAMVMNGAQIGEDSIIGAGVVCTENMLVPAGSVVVRPDD